MEIASIIVGLILIGLFVYSNFYLDERWAALQPAFASNGRSRAQGGVIRGVVEAALFLSGVALTTAGLAFIGIGAGYGGF